MNARHAALAAGLALLAAFGAQSILAVHGMSATSDEATHLAAGYTYLTTGDLRLNPQHPPLMKMLAAAPLIVLRPALDRNDPAWTSSPPREWEFGTNFLYANDADRLLWWARLPIVALAVGLGVVVWRWASEMHGRAGGLLAVFLYAWCPNLIAHSHFVTMDLGLAAFSTAHLWLLWRWSRSGSRPALGAAAVLLGLALAAKFSALLLLPAVVILVFAGAQGSGAARARRGVAALAVCLAVAAVVVWAAYLFPTDPSFYLDGARRVNADHDPGRAYYLNGQFRVGGFPHYFLAAFAWKTPVVVLALLVLSIPWWRRLAPLRRLDDAFVVLPAAVFFVGTSAFADNLGVRYLLPVFPWLYVYLGRWGRAWTGSRAQIAVAAVAAVALAVPSLRTYPDHLAYFNALAGGPSQGWKHLDDSNLDWGQDLKRLRRWMDDNGVDRIRLLYPWNARPEYYGIRYDPVTPDDWFGTPKPGTYVMATVWLVRGLHEARERGVPTDWLERYEPVDRIGQSFFVYRFPPPSGHPR